MTHRFNNFVSFIKAFKMITKQNLFGMFAFLTCGLMLIGCSLDPEEVDGGRSGDSSLSFTVTDTTTSKTVVLNGDTIVFTFGHKVPNNIIRRSIGYNDDTVYERNPNAHLAPTPKLVSYGSYKKYAIQQFPPFAALRGVSVAVLRLDKFSFTCSAPAGTKLFSFDITNITPQGFANENATSRGFHVDGITQSTRGVFVDCSFYIQDGIAYDIAGMQLTPNTYYPLPGEKVQYQYTY